METNKDSFLASFPLDEDSALRTILEGTSAETGEPFFAALVRSLAKVLGTSGAWVTEVRQECRRLRALAFWLDGEWVDDYELSEAPPARPWWARPVWSTLPTGSSSSTPTTPISSDMAP